ncbi:MAG TPA: Ldh family oxidoreductase [Verrucomicrobiae bacterium]|nr:Ldh family oxidoreductase [Verrucomicrobiae bacterium]
MKVAVSELTKKFKALLATSGASEWDVNTLASLYLEEDLRDNYFSALWSFEEAIERLKKSKDKKHTIEVDKPALKLINCNGRTLGLAAMELVPELCRMAKEQGIAILGFYNGGYQVMPEAFVRAIAAEDLVGLTSSAGGPQGVLPHGGSKDLLGTNPLAYGIPTNGLPIVFDASTAQYAYGSIKIAKEKGQTLPEKSYVDADGDWTTDPAKAIGIIPFGEHRGYAINLLLEVLTGALVGAKSGLLQKDEMDMGCFMIAIDPAAFGSLDEFKAQTTKLARDIETSKPVEGFSEVRVPGYKSERHKQKVLQEDSIEVDEAMWNKFMDAYKERVKTKESQIL